MALPRSLVYRPQPRQPYPGMSFGRLTTHAIEGSILIHRLSDPHLSENLYLACGNLTSLTIAHLNDCTGQLTEEMIGRIFAFLQSLTKLKGLKFDNFVHPNPNSLPKSQPSLLHIPISIQHLHISNTHGASLSFLLDHIQPRNVTLDSCTSIRSLPNCASLTLYRIEPSPGFLDTLCKWKGLELVIDSSPFLDETFLRQLRARMSDTGKTIWPGTSVEFADYSPALDRRIIEFIDLLARMETGTSS